MLSFVLLTLVELLFITVYTFFCFVDIDGIVDHHCLNFLGVLHIILKVGHPKIILAQISEQKILM
jgi:hypothetical protein